MFGEKEDYIYCGSHMLPRVRKPFVHRKTFSVMSLDVYAQNISVAFVFTYVHEGKQFGVDYKW